MPDPLLQEPAVTAPPPNRLAEAFRASQSLAPGYDYGQQEPQDDESLLTQFAYAIPRGLEGMARGVYGFADFVAFDSLPDWKKRLLGQSTHWAPGLLEGLATYAIPGTVAVKAFGAAQRGAGWAGRLARLGRSALAGAVVDAVVTDPHGGRLSDWAREAGLENPVTDFLATDPDDSQAMARFKNALEGIVPGVALDAVGEVFHSIRGARAGRGVKVDPKPVRQAMASLWRDEFGFDHDQHAAVESFIEAAGLDRTKIRPASELPPSALFEVARIYHGADRAAFDALSVESRESLVRQMREDGRSGLLDIQDFKTLRQIGNSLGVKGSSHEVLIERIGEAINARAGEALFQPGARAFTLFQEDGTAFIGALKNPDLTSALHELSHVARRQLFDAERGVAGSVGIEAADLATATKWAGAESGWTKEAEEKFASGFEKYLRDGVAPTKALEGFFSRVATYFRRVYQDLTGTALDLEVTPEMAEVFGRVLSRGERIALNGTTVRAVSKAGGGLMGLVKSPTTKPDAVDLVLYSKDGDLRQALPEPDAPLPGPIAPREPPFPGTLEAQVEKATADAAFLYRASLPKDKVLIVPVGTVPDAVRLAKGDYLAWAEEGGAVHLTKPVPIARMGQSTSKADQVLAVKAPGLTRALAQDMDVLYQGARREGDAPEFGNARFDPEQPYEPINLDRIASPEGARKALQDALATGVQRQRQSQPLSTAHARAIETVREFADANGEAVPHDLVKALINKSADQIQEHADRLGAAREVLAGLGVQLHEKIKAATKGGASTASDADLVDILRAQQNIAAITEEVRNVQSSIAQALGAQRIRYRGKAAPAREWIPPRPDQAPQVKPAIDEATPTLLPAGAPDAAPAALPVAISDPKILPGASVKAILDAHGGRAKVEKLVNQLDVWMDANPGGIPPAAVRKGAFSMVPEYYINSILSGPITHATNLVSGAINTLVVPLERALGAAATGQGKIAAAELSEIVSHFREAHRAAKLGGLAFKRDQSLLLGGNAGVLEGGQVRAFSAGSQGLDPESLSGRVLTGIGKVVNIPSRFLLSEDEMVKQINYQARFARRLDEIAQTKFKDAESRAEWVEQMMRAAGEQGQSYGLETLRRRGAELAAKNGITPDQRAEYIAAYVRTHWDEDAHRAALDAEQVARERTFTEEFGFKRGERGLTHLLTGKSGRDTLASFSGGFANLTNQYPALKLFFPFIRTPTNILEWFLDRSVGAVSDGAAFLANSQVRAAYTPEARAALVGRFATGSALITLAATYASQRDENGLPLLTGAGPQDPDERKAWEATGWRPYSMRVGDKYVSYKRLDPSATFFGLVADMVQERAYSESLNRQPEMGKALMIALTNNLVSKTYMLGALNLARAIGEPERHAEQMLEGFAGAAAPFSSAVHQAVNPMKGDDVLHEIRGTMEAFKSKWILSDPNKLPVRRNVLGEPMARDKGIGGDPWSPLRYVQVQDDPVAEEMVRIGAAFQPPRETSNGVDWTGYKNEGGQNAYDRWMELHGQVQIGGRTLRQALERTIASRSYQRLPATGVDDLDSPRVAALRRIVSRYRSVAQRQTMQEYPDLSSDARKLLVATRLLKTGQAVQATGVQ